MLVQTVPDTITKLAQLDNTTNFEPSGDQPQVEHKRVPYQSCSLDECITNVVTSAGKKPILKTMMTSVCERNGHYCPFHARRIHKKRIAFSPHELAQGLNTLQGKDQVDGISLLLGIIKGSLTAQG